MKNIKTQSGAVLAVSLIMLTAITFLAFMGMQRSGLQTRIVANIQQKEIVFNDAKAEFETAFGEYRDYSTQRLSDAIEKNGGSIPTNLDRKHFDKTQTTSSVKYLPVAASKGGQPVTSRLRNDYSRGQDGAGIEEFEVETLSKFDNGIASNQLLGINFYTPR